MWRQKKVDRIDTEILDGDSVRITIWLGDESTSFVLSEVRADSLEILSSDPSGLIVRTTGDKRVILGVCVPASVMF